MAENPRPLGDAIEEREHEFVRQQGMSELDFAELYDLALKHAAAAAQVGAPRWRFVGPRNVGGRIVSLGQSPEDPRIIYAGAAQGGLWRSIDAGDTWDRLGDESQVFAVGAIAVAPTSPNTVYFGTGAHKPTYIGGRGLFRATIDGATGGATIEELAAVDPPTLAPASGQNGKALRYTRIRVDPYDATRFWVASQTGLWQCVCPTTSPPAPQFTLVFPTADSTPQAAQRATTVDGTGMWPSHSTDLLVSYDPRDTETTQLGTIEVPRYLILYVGVSGAGVYRGRFDRESGTTEFEDDPLDVPMDGITFTRVRLALCETAPQNVFAVFADTPNDDVTNVYRSSDNGDNWTKGTQSMSAAGAGVGGGSYMMTLECAPDDPRVLICGALEVCLSADGGDSWTKILDWLRYDLGDKAQHADQHTAMFDLADHRRVWIGNDGGLSLARDLRMPPQANGYWRKRSHGIYAGMCQDVSVNPALPFMCAVGFQDNGSYLSLGGSTWLQVGGGDGGACAFVLNNPRQLFVSWQGPLPPQTQNARGLERVDVVPFDAPLVPPANYDLITLAAHDIPENLARGHGVKYRWTAMTHTANGFPAGNPANFIGVVEQHPTLPGNLLLGRQNDGFFSTNFGANWTSVSAAGPISPAPPRSVTAMAFGHAEPPTAPTVDGWAGTSSGFLFFAANAMTQTWAPAPRPLPFPGRGLPISEIVVHPTDRRIVAVSATGVQGRVFLTYDQGQTWIDLTEPTPSALVVTPAGASLQTGKVRGFRAEATYPGVPAAIDVTARAAWSSSNPGQAAVVTVTGGGNFLITGFRTEGQVTGGAAGTPSITATLLAGVPTATASQAITITLGAQAEVPFVPADRTIVPGSLPPGPCASVIFDPSVAANAPMRLFAATLAGVYALPNVPAIASLAIRPAGPLTFQTNSPTFQLQCVATLTDGSVIDVTKAVDWSGTAIGAATVGTAAPNEGLVTFSAVVGTDTITAARIGVASATVDITTQAAAIPAPGAPAAIPPLRPPVAWHRYGAGLPQVLITDFERVGNSTAMRAATFGLGVFETVLTGGHEQHLFIRQTIIEDGRTPRANPPVIPDDPRLPALAVALDLTHSFDIRVDAPPYSFFDDVVDGVELDESLEVSDPVPTEDNYVYVQVHNSGVADVPNVKVHLYAAECADTDVVNPIGSLATASPASLEASPIAEFYEQPNRDPVGTSKWKRVDVARVLDKVPSDAPRVVRFTWTPDAALGGKNVALLAFCEGDPNLPTPNPAGATLSAFILAERRAALRIVKMAPRPVASVFVRDGVADDTRIGGYPVGGRSPDIMVVHPDITDTREIAFKNVVSRRLADTVSSTDTNFIYVRVHNRRRFATKAMVKVFAIDMDDAGEPRSDPDFWTELPAGESFAEVTIQPQDIGYARIEFPNATDPNLLGTSKNYLLVALVKDEDNVDPLPNKDRVETVDAFWELVQRYVDSDNAAARVVPWV